MDDVIKEMHSFYYYMDPGALDGCKQFWVHFPISEEMNFGWTYYELDKGSSMSSFKRKLKSKVKTDRFFHGGVLDFNTRPEFYKDLLKKNYILISAGARRPEELL